MSNFVIDASVTLPWCFKDEATSETEALLGRLRAGDTAIVPAHWPTEVMNGLIMAVRRNRIALADVLEFADVVSSLPVQIEPAVTPDGWRALLAIAAETRLTIYDAAYLQLARDRNIPLATFDQQLQTPAAALSVELLMLA